jgi:hypothetical protein
LDVDEAFFGCRLHRQTARGVRNTAGDHGGRGGEIGKLI